VRIDVDAMHVRAQGEVVVSQHPPHLAFGGDFVVYHAAGFQLQMLRVGRCARLLVYASAQLVDRVVLVESDLCVALVEVRVGQIEDESGSGEGVVLRRVGGHDVRFERKEVLIFYG